MVSSKKIEIVDDSSHVCFMYVSINFLSTHEETTTHFDKMVLFKQVIDHDISPLTLDLLYMVLKSEKN